MKQTPFQQLRNLNPEMMQSIIDRYVVEALLDIDDRLIELESKLQLQSKNK